MLNILIDPFSTKHITDIEDHVPLPWEVVGLLCEMSCCVMCGFESKRLRKKSSKEKHQYVRKVKKISTSIPTLNKIIRQKYDINTLYHLKCTSCNSITCIDCLIKLVLAMYKNNETYEVLC